MINKYNGEEVIQEYKLTLEWGDTEIELGTVARGVDSMDDLGDPDALFDFHDEIRRRVLSSIIITPVQYS